MTGHYDFRAHARRSRRAWRAISSEAACSWRRAAAGLKPFDAAFRRELKKALPEAEFVKLPPTHPLFAGGWNAGREGRLHARRRCATTRRWSIPEFYGLFLDGRLAVLYTPFDLMSGVNRESNAYAKGVTSGRRAAAGDQHHHVRPEQLTTTRLERQLPVQSDRDRTCDRITSKNRSPTCSSHYQRMLDEFGKVIVGQRDVLEELLITVFAGGHNLLEGVPGLAKTLMINTLAQLLSLEFKRIQFTPDLMPSDIVGTNVIEEDHTTGKRVTVFVAGPIFTNIVLADEINRTPPKTQAALLQAMQEKEVTAGGKTYKLEKPFFVLATQNPIDQEGTYPLPEAQKDRFLMNTFIKYPKLAEEEDDRRADDDQRRRRSASRSATARSCWSFSSWSAAFPSRSTSPATPSTSCGRRGRTSRACRSSSRSRSAGAPARGRARR